MGGLFREEVVSRRKDSALGQVTIPTGRWFATDSWIPFFGQSRVPVILQTEHAECGLACVAMVAAYHGGNADLATLRRRFSVSARGLTLAQLISIGQRMALSPRALRLEIMDLPQLRCPAVLHWNLDHYVVLERMRGHRALIVDPSAGRRTVSSAELSASFTGVALELEPSPAFSAQRESTPLPLMSFVSESPGLLGALAQLLALSLVLQALVLLGPLFGQIVIDRIIADSNPELLTIVALAFLLLAFIQIGISGLRGWLVVVMGANLRLSWSTRLFHHLMRLPLAWFERRHIGDVASRFGSLRAVEGLVTGAAVEAVVDGLLALTTLAVMLNYSIELSVVAMSAVALYLVTRAAMLPALRHATHDALSSESREQSVFMESVRAIAPLKNFGREGLREATWRNRKSASLRAGVRLGRLRVIQHCLNGLVIAAASVGTLWLGALEVLDGAMTVGMLFAFIAYKTQFTTRAATLVDRVMQYHLVVVHLERIADIALADREIGDASDETALDVRGAITTDGLCFRYSDTDPWVLSQFNMSIAPGECVAIASPSGSGKSTLIKLLLGLLAPTSGRICVDGIALNKQMIPAWRSRAAAVLQDDMLLSGTLADNVTCFDPSPDLHRVRQCAALAAIDDEISRMPMGWHTLIGDMGNALSGGQRQRLLLARALYANPRVLFLDEATSQLDSRTESRIHEALGRMEITRVIAAHRKETLAIADRVIRLDAA